MKQAPAASCGTHSEKQQGIFYMHHPTDRIVHTSTFGWNENKLNLSYHDGSIPSDYDRTLFNGASYISLPTNNDAKTLILGAAK